MTDISRDNSLFMQLKAAKKEKKGLLIQQFNQLYEIDAENIRERKHSSLITCPYCHQIGVTRCYGYADSEKKRHRFHCKPCNRHFNDHTGTLFHNRKLRQHIPLFLKMMLENKSLRYIADSLHISPTTAHKWRHLVLQYIEQHMSSYVNKLFQPDIITETSIREINPSQKGLHGSKPIVPFTHIIQFQYNRLGRFCIKISPSHLLKTKQELVRADESIHLNGKPVSRNSISLTDQRLLLHCKHVQHFQAKFDDMYQKMRGVAQPYLNRYLQWYCFMEQIYKLNTQEKLKTLMLNCL